MKSRTTSQKEMNAVDALAKIRALLGAAQFLTSGDDEREAMLELLGLAEDVAVRVLEAEA